MAAPKFLSTPLYQEPTLEIVRQPQKRGYRFRYSSEGVTHGGIRGEAKPGENNNTRLYPTIKLYGYRGAAKVVVTIVTGNNDPNEKALLHAHSLIVNKQKTEGYHVYNMDGKDPSLEFPTIAIQHVVKEKLVETLMDRILQTRFLEKYGWGNSVHHTDARHYSNLTAYTNALSNRKDDGNHFVHRETNQAIVGEELAALKKQAEDLQKSMDMNKCRLSFQVFIKGEDGHFSKKLDPVYSDIIYDGKTKHGASLKIMRINKVTSSVNGDEEVWLIADKLHAGDLEVRFFEEPKPGLINGWEGFGKFQKTDVLKQICLIFRTPEYHDKHIDQPVTIHMQLRRKSDPDCISEPQAFKYTPINDRYSIGEKRKKQIPMAEIIGFSESLQKRPYLPTNNATFNFPNMNFLNMIGGNQPHGGIQPLGGNQTPSHQLNANAVMNFDPTVVTSTAQFTGNQPVNYGTSTYMNLNNCGTAVKTNAMNLQNLLSSSSSATATSLTDTGLNFVNSQSSRSNHTVSSAGMKMTSVPTNSAVKVENEEARAETKVQVMECSNPVDSNGIAAGSNTNNLSDFANFGAPSESLVNFLNDNIYNNNENFL